MYKLLLTFRYLRRKLIPLFAMVAVLLCTAMVIIVMSVMGGFLNLLRDAGRTVMGDVSVSSGLAGFPHYEELIADLEKLPQVAAAAPTIDAFGLFKIGDYIAGVQVVGIQGRRQAQVTAFSDILHWTPEHLASEPRIAQFYGPFNPVETALDMKAPWAGVEDRPVIVTGIEVNPGNRRRPDGSYAYYPSILTTPVTLSLLPITRQAGTIEPATDEFLVVNEFSSGVYDVDKQRVYIPFDKAQEMLLMAEAPRFAVNPDGTPKIENGRAVVEGVSPARCTEIQIKAAPGVTADELRQAVDDFYHKVFLPRHNDLPPFMNILTWEERQASFLAAVENEKGLMTSLFGGISVTAFAMVGVIFYMIVATKTRDIGILRSLGATKAGIAAIFLSFAAALGILGSILGSTVAFLIVYYINEIHAWLGDGLGGAALVFGVPIGVLTIVALVAGGHVAIRSVFELTRRATPLVMAAVGLCLGLLPLAAWTYAALWGRAGWPGGHALAFFLIGAGAFLVLFLLTSVAYLGVDRLIRTGSAKKVLAFAAAAGLVAAVGVLMVVAMSNLKDRMNDAIRVQIWDRSVYFFDRIPNDLDGFEISIVNIVAVVACIVAALIPAVKAALVDPVDSLRYE